MTDPTASHVEKPRVAPPPNGAPPAGPDSERRRLRSFGLTVGIAFLVLTAFLFWKDRPAWPVFAGLGGLLILLGLAVPTLLRPVERVWMKLAGYLGWFMTRVILGLVFVLIFTPAGLIVRLLGKDPLHLRFDRDAQSYWLPRESDDRTPARMERMF